MGSTRHTQQHEPPRTAMSLYIDSASHLHHDQEKNLVVTCPHCQAVAHITPTAVPRFEDLQLYRPNQVGLVYMCDACHAPIFLRFTVRVYGTTRIELSPQFTEVERAREKFSFAYVPEDVELLFREALTCFWQSTKRRALRNRRIQPLYSPASRGRQEFCTWRNERSGCGMVMVTRPSRFESAAMPKGVPLGLAG